MAIPINRIRLFRSLDRTIERLECRRLLVNAPTELTAVWDPQTNQVNLSWRDNAQNETSYAVQRGDGELGYGGPVVATLAFDSTNAHINVEPNHKYLFQVSAIAGNEWSNPASIVVSTPKAPTAPDAPVALINNAKKATITWRAFPGARSYVLQRFDVLNNYQAVDYPLSAKTLSFSQAVPPGSYEYKIHAVMANGSWVGSANSNRITFTSGLQPTAPGNIQAQLVNDKVRVSWDDSRYETNYYVYRMTPSGADNTLLSVLGANATSFLDPAVVGTWRYRVTAVYVNLSAPSALSNAVTVAGSNSIDESAGDRADFASELAGTTGESLLFTDPLHISGNADGADHDYYKLDLSAFAAAGVATLKISTSAGADFWSVTPDDPSRTDLSSVAGYQFNGRTSVRIQSSEELFLHVRPGAGAYTFTLSIEAALAPDASKLANGVNISNWFHFVADRSGPGAIPTLGYVPLQNLKDLLDAGVRSVRLALGPQWLVGNASSETSWDLSTALRSDTVATLNAVIDQILSVSSNGHSFSSVLLVPHGFELATPSGINPISSSDPNDPNSGFNRFVTLWRNLAGTFSRSSDPRIAFDLINEPQFGGLGAKWDLLQDRLVTAIRSTGANNTIVSSGNDGGVLSGLAAVRPVADANTVYSFHYYDSQEFTSQGSIVSRFFGDVRGWMWGLTYPRTDADRSAAIAFINTQLGPNADSWSYPVGGSTAFINYVNHFTDYAFPMSQIDNAWSLVRGYRYQLEASTSIADKLGRERTFSKIAAAANWASSWQTGLYAGEFGVNVHAGYTPSQFRSRQFWFDDVADALTLNHIPGAVWGYDDPQWFGIAVGNNTDPFYWSVAVPSAGSFSIDHDLSAIIFGGDGAALP